MYVYLCVCIHVHTPQNLDVDIGKNEKGTKEGIDFLKSDKYWQE